MTEITTTTTGRSEDDTRRKATDILVYLFKRGASTEVIQLAMVRAGLSVEIARTLAQCVGSARMAYPPMPAQNVRRQIDRSGRAAEIALHKLINFVILVGVIWVVGITLGFAVGMEMGYAKGIENGLDWVRSLLDS